jgi:hypothetical protein
MIGASLLSLILSVWSFSVLCTNDDVMTAGDSLHSRDSSAHHRQDLQRSRSRFAVASAHLFDLFEQQLLDGI